MLRGNQKPHASFRRVFHGSDPRLHNAVVVTLRAADAEAARAAMAGVDGVAGVELVEERDGRVTLQALAAEGASPAAPVSALARDSGWHVHGLSVERGRLDEVFRQITGAGDAGAEAARG